MTDHVVIDQVGPERIVQKIGGYKVSFSESLKGEGNPGDGNFQDLKTDWRRESHVGMVEIWLELLRRNVARMEATGHNFIEFWGWPEVRVRDDGTCQIAARVRIHRVSLTPPAPRVH